MIYDVCGVFFLRFLSSPWAVSFLRTPLRVGGASNFAFAMHRRHSAAISLLSGELIERWYCASLGHALSLSDILWVQAHVEVKAYINTANPVYTFRWSENLPVSGELPCGGRFSTFELKCSSARASFSMERIINAVNSVARRARSAIACDELPAFVRRERVRIARLAGGKMKRKNGKITPNR